MRTLSNPSHRVPGRSALRAVSIAEEVARQWWRRDFPSADPANCDEDVANDYRERVRWLERQTTPDDVAFLREIAASVIRAGDPRMGNARRLAKLGVLSIKPETKDTARIVITNRGLAAIELLTTT